ncbi:MAG: DUF1559 family PulG-like putative transporter, partial [Planctomycetota bacterium]
EDIADGASNTIAIMGVTRDVGAWASGGRPTVRALTQHPYVNGPDGFGSGQPGGMLVGMADGSVRFISNKIDPIVLKQLVTANGGEDVRIAWSPPWRDPEADGPKGKTAPDPPESATGGDEPVAKPEGKAHPGEIDPTDPVVEPVEVDVTARLGDPVVKIDFPGVPLVDVVDLISRMSTLRISFDLDSMPDPGEAIRDPVTVRLSDTTVSEVLDAVLAERGHRIVVQNDHLLVTTREARNTSLRPVRYEVADLTGQGPTAAEELARLVQQFVAPDSWRSSGGPGTLEVREGALTATQTDAVQRQVSVFCKKLRLARGLTLETEGDLRTRLSLARLNLMRPVTTNFHEPAPLVRILADLEELTQTEIVVNWLAAAGVGVSPETKTSLSVAEKPFSEALDELLRPLSLGCRVIDSDTLEVTSGRELVARLELEFHPVGDLLSPTQSPAALVRQIRQTVAKESWSDSGGPGAIRFDEPSGHLLVLASQPVQFALESVLAQWRAEKGKAAGDGY